MARKTTRKKTPAKGKRTTKKAATTRKKTTARKTTRTTKKAAPKKIAKPRRKSTSRKAAPKTTPPPPIFSNLSLDRKLDLIGVFLALVGLLTGLGLLSSSNSAFLSTIFRMIGQAFGWGMYLLPLSLIGVGLWLILRDFDRIPRPEPERLAGLVFLFANILTLMHFTLLPANRAASLALAVDRAGGGYFGAYVSSFLTDAFGLWGTTIILLAWLLIGTMLTLDVSVVEIVQWTNPFLSMIRRSIKTVSARAFLTFRGMVAARRTTPLPATGEAAPTAGQQPQETSQNGAAAGEPAPVVTTGIADMAAASWTLPAITDMLEEGADFAFDDDFNRDRALLIEETLASFGAPAKIVEVNPGPTITQFGVEPGFLETRNGRTRVRVNKISALADDLALALAASRIRIQAPVPGKGYIGIEVPNDEISLVSLRDMVESKAFENLKSPLRFALGQDVSGNAVATTLAAMPHLLVAGATGSGKSVCVNSIIACMLLNHTPEELRIIMVDPKRVELTNYNGIPHLLAPVVVEMDRVVGALQWVTREMDARYQKFHDEGARNISSYNKKMIARGERKLPYLVVIIDELADLMMLAPDQTEKAVTRLAQLARATGIHLIIATQRPSVDVVTGLIKANFPARVAFAVASSVDSRVILDQPGAERLLGRGDMLFQAPDAPAPIRLQGVFVSDPEINRITQYWRHAAATAGVSTWSDPSAHTTTAPDAVPASIPLKQMPIWEEMEEEDNMDPLYHDAIDLIRRQGRASISMLQRRMRIGYTRAARLIETMEAKGIIGPPVGGAQTRQVLDYGDAAPPVGE